MDKMQPRNIKQFHARQYIIILIVLCIIACFFTLMLPTDQKISIGLPIIVIIRTIWQYNMIYISIGEDYITYRPTAPLRGETSILFKEITSVSYEKNKVIINYLNKISNNEHTVKIPLSVMEKEAKEQLLASLHIILKDKEK